MSRGVKKSRKPRKPRKPPILLRDISPSFFSIFSSEPDWTSTLSTSSEPAINHPTTESASTQPSTSEASNQSAIFHDNVPSGQNSVHDTAMGPDELPYDPGSQTLRLAGRYPDYVPEGPELHPSPVASLYHEEAQVLWGIRYHHQHMGQTIDEHAPSLLHNRNVGSSTSYAPFIFTTEESNHQQMIDSGYGYHPEVMIQNDHATQPPFLSDPHPQDNGQWEALEPDSFVPHQLEGDASMSSTSFNTSPTVTFLTDGLDHQSHSDVHGHRRRAGAMQMQMRSDPALPCLISSDPYPQDGQWPDDTNLSQYQSFPQ